MPSILERMQPVVIDPVERNRLIAAQQRALKAQWRKDMMAEAEKYNNRHQPLKPEKLYEKVLKAGLAKIVRRRGKPPMLVWLR